MLSADSDEGIGGDAAFHRQESAGEHFRFARDEMNVGIIDVTLTIEDFVDTQLYVTSQFKGFSEVIVSIHFYQIRLVLMR